MPTPNYRFVSGDEYLSLPSAEQTWIIEPLIPAGGLVNIYGQPKEAKKSWMAINMALAITNGWDALLRFPVRTWGPVVYLQVDTPRTLWRPRFELARRNGFDIGLIYLADPELVPYPLDLIDEEQDHTSILITMVEELVAERLGGEPPLVVFIDTLREVHGGDEDKSTIMRNVIARLRAAFVGSAIVLISHSRKTGQDNGAADHDGNLMGENRGSGYISGRMDTVIRLTPRFMSYQGRAVGKERLKLSWDKDTGLFSVESDPVRETAKIIISLHKEDTERALARRLVERMAEVQPEAELTEDAARSVIRRIRERKE